MVTTRYTNVGKALVVVIDTIASATLAPTAAEANGGTQIQTALRSMPVLPRPVNLIPTPDLSSKQEKQIVGTRGGGEAIVEFLRKLETETERATLPEDYVGYLAVFRQGTADGATDGTATIAAADVCDVYPIEVGAVEPAQTGRNEADYDTVRCAITDDVGRDLAVLA